MDDVDCTHTPHALTRKLTPLYPTVQFIEQMSQVASTRTADCYNNVATESFFTVLKASALMESRFRHEHMPEVSLLNTWKRIIIEPGDIPLSTT